jgi:hypothetical protein
LRAFDWFSRMIHLWKARISRSIFVSVARQPNKHVLSNHARKLRCHFRVQVGTLLLTHLPSEGAYGCFVT